VPQLFVLTTGDIKCNISKVRLIAAGVMLIDSSRGHVGQNVKGKARVFLCFGHE